MGFETAFGFDEAFALTATFAADLVVFSTTLEVLLVERGSLTTLNSSGPLTTLLVLAGVVLLGTFLGAVFFTTFLGVGSFLGVCFLGVYFLGVCFLGVGIFSTGLGSITTEVYTWISSSSSMSDSDSTSITTSNSLVSSIEGGPEIFWKTFLTDFLLDPPLNLEAVSFLGVFLGVYFFGVCFLADF